MKRAFIFGVVAALYSSTAMAFEITGGDLTATTIGVRADDGYSFSQYELQGNFAVGLGSSLGLQAGVSLGNYTDENPYRIGELALTYSVAPGLTAAAFFGMERYHETFHANYFGIAGLYEKEKLTIEAALVSENATNGNNYFHKAVVVDATFGLNDKVSLLGSVHVLREYDETNRIRGYVGVKYAISPSLAVSASVGRGYTENAEGGYGLALSMTHSFGKPLFNQHGFNSLLPGT